jgi:hypothetical protein
LALLGFRAFAQDTGKDPYAIFGHKSTTKYETKASELLQIKNADTASPTRALVFDVENGCVLFLDNNNNVLNKVKLSPEQILRFISSDPASKEYPSLSPYVYVGNNPLNAIDPDGQRIIFVNGFYSDNWFGRNVAGSDKGGSQYWSYNTERNNSLNSSFVRGAQGFFKDNGKISESNFVDGSAGMLSSASGRYDAGYEYAKSNLKVLTADMVEGETFKMVSHSQGGAYAAGIETYLIEQGYKVETAVYLSPHQTQGFTTPSQVNSLQLGYNNDPVSLGSDQPIAGSTRMGTVDKGFADVLTNHGSTRVGTTIWQQVADLQSIQFTPSNHSGSIPGTGVILTGPSNTYSSSGTTQNGTQFSKVNVGGTTYKSTSTPSTFVGPLRY